MRASHDVFLMRRTSYFSQPSNSAVLGQVPAMAGNVRPAGRGQKAAMRGQNITLISG
jgi:hypothetical protein